MSLSARRRANPWWAGQDLRRVIQQEGGIKLPRRGDSTRSEWLEIQQHGGIGMFRRDGLPPDEMADRLEVTENQLYDKINALTRAASFGERRDVFGEMSDAEIADEEAAARARATRRTTRPAGRSHRITVYEDQPGVWIRSEASRSRRAGVRINARGPGQVRIILEENS